MRGEKKRLLHINCDNVRGPIMIIIIIKKITIIIIITTTTTIIINNTNNHNPNNNYHNNNNNNTICLRWKHNIGALETAIDVEVLPRQSRNRKVPAVSANKRGSARTKSTQINVHYVELFKHVHYDIILV